MNFSAPFYSLNISHYHNSTNSTQNASMSPSKVLVWAVVSLLISIIGCINNGLVLYVTWPRAGDKSGVNLLIFHFLIANLLQCLIHLPIRCFMVLAKQAGFPGDLNACYFIQTFNSANWLVVYWSDAGLAMNRCVALFFPHSYKTYSTTPKNVLQIVLMWSLSVGFLLPYDFGHGARVVILPIGHCAYRGTGVMYESFFGVFKYAPFVVAGVGSSLILAKCYIFGALRSNNRNDSSVVRNRILSAKVLVLTYLWSVACNIPSGIIISVDPKIFDRVPMANLWLQTGSQIQYALSACLILLSNKKYQERLRGLGGKVRISPVLTEGSHSTDRGHSLQTTDVKTDGKATTQTHVHIDA